MQTILILNNLKLHSQVLIKISGSQDESRVLTLDNTTKNTYKAYLEICFSHGDGTLIHKEISDEIQLHPGIFTLSENETENIVYEFYKKNIANGSITLTDNFKLSVCVKQKYGPDLGFQYIQL